MGRLHRVTVAKNSPFASAHVLCLCALALFIDGFDIQALGLAAPALAEDFGIPPTGLAPAMSATLVGMAIGAIALGPWGDKVGLRSTAITMLALIGSTMLMTATAHNAVSLAVWRFLTGLGMGAIAPIAVSLAAQFAPDRWRTLVLTLVISATGIGSLAASFAAPAIEEQYDWHGIFLLGGVVPFFAAVGFFFVSAEKKQPASHQPLTKASVSKLFTPTLKARTVLLWAIFFLNQLIIYALLSWLPSLLEMAGWERPDAQRGAGYLAIGGLAGGLILAWLCDRRHAGISLIAAYCIGGASLAIFMLGGLPVFIQSMMLMVIGLSVFGPMIVWASIAAFQYPIMLRATGLGWASGIGRSGGILGPILISFLIVLGSEYDTILMLQMIPMAICGILAAILFYGRRFGVDA